MGFDKFRGKIYQVIEAVDVFDACSDHVLNIKNLLKDEFGLDSDIYAKHIHPNCAGLGIMPIERLIARDDDVVIYHFSGFSEHCLDYVIASKALKILHYHNITPHLFFEKGSYLYDFCLNGRDQLKRSIDFFDFASGDSRFNLDELINLGFPEERCFLLPIIFQESISEAEDKPVFSDEDYLVSVGRICENKCQIKLVESFAKLNYSGRLYLVGGYSPQSSYYQKLVRTIQNLGLDSRVVITGKLKEEDYRSAIKYSRALISRSEHEGFCVPLIEASFMGVPVLAFSAGAVPETLGQSPGLYSAEGELTEKFDLLNLNAEFRKNLIKHQLSNLRRFERKTLIDDMQKILEAVLGKDDRFKSVSVVICTLNRADFLDRALDYLESQYSNCFEVIVVNGPSDDHTSSVIDRWRDKIKYYENPSKNLSVSRNIGIEAAAGDIVAFIDDDAIPFLDWVDNILDAFNWSHNLTAGIGGPTYFSGTLEFQARDIAVDYFGDGVIDPPAEILSSKEYVRSLLGTNAAFRKDALLSIGGFDEQYDYYLDETDVCFTLVRDGWKISHYPEAFLRHEFAQSENRESNYQYNYFSICKNTVYFAQKFSANYADAVEIVKKRLINSRVSFIEEGISKGRLDKKLGERLISDVWSGFEKGIADYLGRSPRERYFGKPEAFLKYKESKDLFVQRHIVIITSEFPPFTKSGGVGTLYYNLASELLIRGHKVTVITESESLEEKVVMNGRFQVHFLKRRSDFRFSTGSAILEKNLSWAMTCANRLQEVNSVSKVHIVESCIWDLEGYAASLLKEEMEFKFVLRLVTPFLVVSKINRWNLSSSERDVIKRFELECIDRADLVVPISDSIKETFVEEYGIATIGNFRRIEAGIANWPSFDVSSDYGAISMPSFENKIRGEFTVTFLGRLELRKGIDVFLQAVAKLVKGGFALNTSFMVAGEDHFGLDQYLKDEELEFIKPNLVITGPISPSFKESVLASSDVVVFPSRYESFGLVPLEAFVHGTPVIGSNAGAIPEVIADGKCGLLFSDGDSGDLARCIQLVKSDRLLLKELSQGAKTRARELSSKAMAVKTEKAYEELVRCGQ